MVWWKDSTEYIYETGLEPGENADKDKAKSFWGRVYDIFFQEAIDILYFFLGVFTYIYLFAIAFLYLSGVSSFDTISSKIIKALAEPYLGAVGIYTILKESRKRKYSISPRHWGELFVIAWICLLALASFLTVVFSFYTFTHTLELIITLTISIGIIYMGSVLHRP